MTIHGRFSGEHERKRMLRGFRASLATLATIVCLGTATTCTYASTTINNPTTETVMVVGGSIAYGWDGSVNDSYVQQAFQALSSSSSVQYTYDDQAVVDGSPLKINSSGDFKRWLAADRPQVVVLAWGLENDASAHATTSAIEQAIRTEISEAMATDAVVIVTSPPVTEAIDTTLHKTVEQYIEAEKADVNTLQSPNVHFVNLNQIMGNYLVAHNQSWQDYFGDSWHPDAAGHILAGQLLYSELNDIANNGALVWQGGASPISQNPS